MARTKVTARKSAANGDPWKQKVVMAKKKVASCSKCRYTGCSLCDPLRRVRGPAKRK